MFPTRFKHILQSYVHIIYVCMYACMYYVYATLLIIWNIHIVFYFFRCNNMTGNWKRLSVILFGQNLCCLMAPRLLATLYSSLA